MLPFTFVATAVGLLWLGLLLASPHTRFEQVVMSAFGLLLAPATLFLVAPTARSLADFVFVVSLFGVAAVAYHALVDRHADRWRGKRLKSRPHIANWVAHLMIAGGAWMTIAIAAKLVLAVPEVQAFTLGGLLIGIYVVADRKDLLLKALLTGIFAVLLVLAVEAVFSARLFLPTVPPLAGLPIEEILWAAVVGFTVGPLYEYVRHLRKA